ncbi:uncharacterized protein LOC130721429 [Lotus japonicus]|uniref:uncharacterized protein LOC130721429 n=1 Tax=Lotus japonicus TaxID=34305 RepID=UPI00258A8AE0|nr:uncharacterized protein LOC130721429 [Lotus japonicus]
MNNLFNFIDERNKENTKIDTGDDRVESIGRRRIRGIVSSEEKKHHDKGRQLVLALPIPNNSFYHVNKRNKGKAKIGIVDPLDGFTKYETHGQTKKGPKRKEGGHVSIVTTILKTHKRNTYGSQSENTLNSEFLNLNKSNIQLNKDPSNYKDSLLRFVEDQTPVVQKFAAKKLESLKFEKLQDGNTPTSNLLENVSPTQTIHSFSPQAQTQSNTFNPVHMCSLSLPFLNKPLEIPGTTTQQLKKANTLAGSNNVKDADYKGKEILRNFKWNASEPSILSSVFCDDIQEKNQIGYEISNENGIMSTFDLSKSKGKFDSPCENMHGKTGKWKSYTSIPDMLVNGSSRSGLTHINRTDAVSGPQHNRLEPRTKKCLSGPSFFPQIRPEDTISSTNLSNLSLMSWPRLKGSMYGTSDYKPLNQCLTLQEVPEDSTPTINFLESFSTSDPKLGSPIAVNDSFPFCLSQPRPERPISGDPRNNLLELSVEHHQPCSKPETVSVNFSNPYQHGEFQAKIGSKTLNNNSYPNQVNSRASPLNSVSFYKPKSSSSLETLLDVDMNHYGGVVSPIGQREDTSLQLPLDDDKQSNVDLQL